MPIDLVTGGAGFIGSHVVDLLVSRGRKVRVLERDQRNLENLRHHLARNPLNFGGNDVQLYYRDIREIGKDSPFVFNGVDTVYHFAGMMDLVPSIEKPALYMDVNVNGTVAVLEAARKAGVKRFVYAASSSCYGDNPPCPTTESAPIDLCHPYALSKYLGEQAALNWGRVYGMEVNSIRIFNAYGPRLRGSGTYGAVFGVFLKQKLEGHPFTVVGDGTQSRDFVYVTDLAEAFYLAGTTSLTGKIWNIGAGQPQSVNRIVELLGGGETIALPKRPGEPDCTWADITKAVCELGWHPKVSFAEGVQRTVADIENFAHIPLWTPDSIAGATKEWHRALGR